MLVSHLMQATPWLSAAFVVCASTQVACQLAVTPAELEVSAKPPASDAASPLVDAAASTGSPGIDGATTGDAGVALDATSPSDANPSDGAPPSDAGAVRPPFTGTTELGKLAASMAPGSWAKLTVSNQDAMLGVGSVSGTMIHYCNTMPWNPKNRSIEIVGMDHNAGKQRYVRYDDVTSAFVLERDDTGWGSFTQHGYDHNAVNPYTGDLYHRLFGTFSSTIALKKKPLASNTFSDGKSVAVDAEQQAIGTTWWSGPFAGAGAQGALLVFNSGYAYGNANDGNIVMFDPLANDWFLNKKAMAPFYGSGATYHSVAEYSAKRNVAVYGGGNVAAQKLWRLNADATFDPMPDVPAGKGVGMQNGLLVEEPVTGNFLLLSAGELWELNPSGNGAWTKQAGARVPPAGVGIPGPSSAAPNGVDGVIATAVPDYGVVVFIKQTSQSGGAFWVYRHA